MKIAIMTQPLGKNYGGIMQAFALQKTLKDMGHQVVTIDYNNKSPSFLYGKARLAYRLAKKVTGKRKAPINLENQINQLTEDNRKFIDKYITQSEYIDNDKQLKKHFKKNRYNAVIVGSDQTWRPKYSPNIYNFYLQFLNGKKNIKRIAYASSFGVDNWEYSLKETKKCSKLAASFDAISVREQSGINLCKDHLGVESEFTLDPTLLLEKRDYLELIDDRYKKGKSVGVYTYFLDKSEDKLAAAQYIADELSTHTYSCQAKRSFGDSNSNYLEDYRMPALQDWLASFANSEFVVTDSFHGMIFSIIFEKPFLVIVNKERGAARFESLLSKVGNLECLIYEPSEFRKSRVNIQYIKPIAEKSLKEMRSKSLAFIENSLNNVN